MTYEELQYLLELESDAENKVMEYINVADKRDSYFFYLGKQAAIEKIIDDQFPDYRNY